MTLPLKFELTFKIIVRDFSEGGAYTMFWVAPPSQFLRVVGSTQNAV